MRRRIRTALLAPAAALVIFATVAALAEPDDSHHSLRYQLWKRGRYSFHEGFRAAFMADAHRDSMVLGRTRADLEKTFPPVAER
jgi:hypothetical protein